MSGEKLEVREMFADVNALWYPLTSYSLPLTSLIVNWLVICHTEITEITDFKQKQFKSKKQSLRSKTPCGTLTSYFSPPHRGGAGRGSVVFYLGKVVSRRDADEDGRLR